MCLARIGPHKRPLGLPCMCVCVCVLRFWARQRQRINSYKYRWRFINTSVRVRATDCVSVARGPIKYLQQQEYTYSLFRCSLIVTSAHFQFVWFRLPIFDTRAVACSLFLAPLLTFPPYAVVLMSPPTSSNARHGDKWSRDNMRL